jgi:D-alanyl-D-alanine carboxypeptidase
MKAAVIVLLLLIAKTILAADQAVPDTPAGMLFQKWLAAYNAADGEALRRFVEEHYAPAATGGRSAAEIVDGQLQGRQATKGFDAAEVNASSGNDIDVVLKSRSTFPRYLRLSLKLDDSGKIVARNVGPAAPPAGAEPHRDLQELTNELDAKLTQLTEQDEFSGAALIAKDGEPVWQKAYGLADREKKIAATLDTRFRLGSMPKMFTAVAIAQLVEQGKFGFDDTLAAVLPDYPDQENAAKIRVHHLLTHTSGLGDIFGPEFSRTKDKLRTLGDYLPLFAGDPLRFEPGNSRSYSNAAFIVLGLIIEKHSGQSYYDYLQQHIFDPAGMKSTGNTSKTERKPEIAVGYTRLGGGGNLQPNWETLPYRGMAAGGGESTVGDMLRFANALRSYKLLSREMTELITAAKPGAPGPMPASYGYGFSDERLGDRRVVGHNGGAQGMNGVLSILWDEGYTVVVLANRDPFAAEDAAQFIVSRI